MPEDDDLLSDVVEGTVNIGEGMDRDKERMDGRDQVRLEGPLQTSPEWNNWVMSLFEEDELFEGRPNCNGLRRVARLVLGPIISSRPSQVFPPANGGNEIGRATVVWELVFATGQVFGDVADCWEGNTDDAFCTFNMAMAATRAESRALRKALSIKTASSDEMTSKNTVTIVKELSSKQNTNTEGEYDNSKRMTDPQANFIDIKAKQLDINVTEFFKEVFQVNVKRNVDKQQASNAIEKMNEYQHDKKLIPDSITKYQSDWRSSSK
jgi:hypothetical protein